MVRRIRKHLILILSVACFILVAPRAMRWSSGAAANSSAQSAGKELTVERIWGQPSLSGQTIQGLEWSPDSKMLGFLHRSGPGANPQTDFSVIDATTGERRVLISSERLATFLAPQASRGGGAVTAQSQATGQGRVAPQRFLWSPDSKAILFVTSKGLYWFDLKTGTAKRLAENSGGSEGALGDPRISPDGKWGSFTRNYDLWAVNVATGKETRVTQGGREELRNGVLDWVYPEELSLHTAYWWSPDSSKVAFLQFDERRVTRYPVVNYLTYTGETDWERYPKAGDSNPIVRVGVENVAATSSAAGGTRWMDTGADKDVYIPRVEWLPNSKGIAVQRLNRAQNKLELLFSNAMDGRAQVILTEEDKHWVNVRDHLSFLADGKQFLWGSERDGYHHLFLYDISGKMIRQVTQGDWQVESLEGVDEKLGAILFTSTEKSPTERQLYSVPLEGGAARQLTRDGGAHSISISPDSGHYVDTYSNATTPPRQDLYRADGTRVAVIEENKVPELAEFNLQAPEFFTVRGADGTPLDAMMTKPPGFDESKKYPVIVYIYGGPESQIVENRWAGAAFLWNEMMAQKGFLIFSVDNRGMAGHGHAFETAIFHHFGRDALADQVAAVNWLKSKPWVDGSRIGIWGWSFGGYMTCYAMLNAPDVFKAGFAGSPVTDWRQYDTIYTERYMGRPQDNEEGYRDSSPVNQTAKLKGKLMIAYGTGDDNVHMANTVELAEQFIRAGKYAEIYMYPNRGHGISDRAARVHLFNRVTQFFLENLQ